MKKCFVVLTMIALCLMSLSASAQNDAVKTVSDKGTSGKFFAKLCPKTNVTIDKDEADVYAVYTDGATARFAQGVFQKSKYVIPAGECVIIKTSEEKEVKIEPTTSTRSSFIWNDLICPTTDRTLEEFKTENDVTEGKYIYMLTNLERNGGFGFTHFGGTTLKAGNFYIITTMAPSALGRLVTVWTDANGNVEDETTNIDIIVETEKKDGKVFNLQGVKTEDPTTSGIYINKGRKYIIR